MDLSRAELLVFQANTSLRVLEVYHSIIIEVLLCLLSHFEKLAFAYSIIVIILLHVSSVLSQNDLQL